MKIKFNIHPFYYLTAFICILSGFFKDFILISAIILVHEMGHITGAIICKWKIDKVVIFPFGAITLFNEYLNRKIKEEILIVILGPLFQIIFTFLIYINFNSDLFVFYSAVLLFLNLLPIYPLDGSKIINLIGDIIFSYQKSFLITLYISFITIIIFFFYFCLNYNFFMLFMLLFLFIKNVKEWNNKKYKFKKFIFERTYHDFHFKKIKIISSIYQMKRDFKHIFIIDGKQYTESTYLFDKTNKIC